MNGNLLNNNITSSAKKKTQEKPGNLHSLQSIKDFIEEILDTSLQDRLVLFSYNDDYRELDPSIARTLEDNKQTVLARLSEALAKEAGNNLELAEAIENNLLALGETVLSNIKFKWLKEQKRRCWCFEINEEVLLRLARNIYRTVQLHT